MRNAKAFHQDLGQSVFESCLCGLYGAIQGCQNASMELLPYIFVLPSFTLKSAPGLDNHHTIIQSPHIPKEDNHLPLFHKTQNIAHINTLTYRQGVRKNGGVKAHL